MSEETVSPEAAENDAGEAVKDLSAEEEKKDDRSGHPFRSSSTDNFADILDQLNASILISTYQAGKIIIARREDNNVNTSFYGLPVPMGVAHANGRLAVGTKLEIAEFIHNAAATQSIDPSGKTDACFLMRRCNVTGYIHIHEMEYANDGLLWFINTEFSCLCSMNFNYSFVPRWKPPFITTIERGDKCHLNGLGLVNGMPRYVTFLGKSDTAGGWREDKLSGGCVMDIITNEVLIDGLCMPHSPRWHDGKLWVLESGKGRLNLCNPEKGTTEVVCELPGFTRGVHFVGRHAFIGLSQVRDKVFNNLPITEKEDRNCGVWVVDIYSGEVVGILRFEEDVKEIFSVLLIGAKWPEFVLGGDTLGKTYFIPPFEETNNKPPRRKNKSKNKIKLRKK